MDTLSSRHPIAAALAVTPQAQVVVVYERFSAGLKAKQFFDRYIEPDHPAHRPRFRMWGFASLRNEAVRTQALRDALESDVVSLALLSDARLPAGVELWAESWAQQRGTHHCLLVRLLEPAPIDPAPHSPSDDFLRGVATRANAEFLTGRLDSFGTEQNLHILETMNHL